MNLTLTNKCIDEAVSSLLNAEYRRNSLPNSSLPPADVGHRTHTTSLTVFNAPALPVSPMKVPHRSHYAGVTGTFRA